MMAHKTVKKTMDSFTGRTVATVQVVYDVDEPFYELWGVQRSDNMEWVIHFYSGLTTHFQNTTFFHVLPKNWMIL